MSDAPQGTSMDEATERLSGQVYYVCAACADSYPEQCCRPREELRVVEDGRWICYECYDSEPADFVNEDDAAEFRFPLWVDLPKPPELVPANPSRDALLAEVTRALEAMQAAYYDFHDSRSMTEPVTGRAANANALAIEALTHVRAQAEGGGENG